MLGLSSVFLQKNVAHLSNWQFNRVCRKYRPFHKTLPRSSAYVNWISVRFYKTGCTSKSQKRRKKTISENGLKQFAMKVKLIISFSDQLNKTYLIRCFDLRLYQQAVLVYTVYIHEHIHCTPVLKIYTDCIYFKPKIQ